MIPENIKKLLEAHNKEDNEVGIILASKLKLNSMEFQRMLGKSHINSELLDKYITRKHTGDFKNPYEYFEYIE